MIQAVAMATAMNPGAAGTGAEMSRKIAHAAARSSPSASAVRPVGRRRVLVSA